MIRRYPTLIFSSFSRLPKIHFRHSIVDYGNAVVFNGKLKLRHVHWRKFIYTALFLMNALMLVLYINLLSPNTGNAFVLDKEVTVLDKRVQASQKFIMNNARTGDISADDALLLAKSLVHWGDHFDIDQEYLLGLGVGESNFNKYAISTSNAMGTFQIIPKYHLKEIADAKEVLGKRDIFDVEVQAYLATRILTKYRKASGSMEGALKRYYGSGSAKDDLHYTKGINSHKLRAKKFLKANIDV